MYIFWYSNFHPRRQYEQIKSIFLSNLPVFINHLEIFFEIYSGLWIPRGQQSKGVRLQGSLVPGWDPLRTLRRCCGFPKDISKTKFIHADGFLHFSAYHIEILGKDYIFKEDVKRGDVACGVITKKSVKPWDRARKIDTRWAKHKFSEIEPHNVGLENSLNNVHILIFKLPST